MWRYLWHNVNVDIFATTAAVRDTPIPQRLEMPSFAVPKHLDPIIYPTGVGVSSVSGREGEQQMLSTAIKVTLDPQKSVKVSQTPALVDCTGSKTNGFLPCRSSWLPFDFKVPQCDITWHRRTTAGTSRWAFICVPLWNPSQLQCFKMFVFGICLLQLVEFLDVIDDPILGYTAPVVITVLHTHLATCAVDYRYVPETTDVYCFSPPHHGFLWVTDRCICRCECCLQPNPSPCPVISL